MRPRAWYCVGVADSMGGQTRAARFVTEGPMSSCLEWKFPGYARRPARLSPPEAGPGGADSMLKRLATNGMLDMPAFSYMVLSLEKVLTALTTLSRTP